MLSEEPNERQQSQQIDINLTEDCTGFDLFVRPVLFGNVRQAVKLFTNVRQHKDGKNYAAQKLPFTRSRRILN